MIDVYKTSNNEILKELLKDYAENPREGKHFYIDHFLHICSLYEKFGKDDCVIKGKKYYALYSNPQISRNNCFEYYQLNIYVAVEEMKRCNKNDNANYEGIVIDPGTANYIPILEDLKLSPQYIFINPFIEKPLADKGLIKLGDSMKNVLSRFDNKVVENVTCHDGPVAELDIKPGEVTLIGGRPCMGKTSYALNLMINEVVNRKGSALLVNIAEHDRSIAERTLSIMSNFRMNLKENITDEEYTRLYVAVQSLKDKKLYTITHLYPNIEEVINSVKENYEKVKPTMIVIDYFQLIHYKNNFAKNETEALYILKKLKKLAKELNASMIVLSQLDRKLERRKDLHPKITDIRGAKSAGEIADRVYMLYRDKYYNGHKTMYISDDSDNIDELEVIDVKSKDKKTISYMFNTESGSLEDMKCNN